MERYNRIFQLKWFLIQAALFYTFTFAYLVRLPIPEYEYVYAFAHLGIDSALSYYYKEKKRNDLSNYFY